MRVGTSLGHGSSAGIVRGMLARSSTYPGHSHMLERSLEQDLSSWGIKKKFMKLRSDNKRMPGTQAKSRGGALPSGRGLEVSQALKPEDDNNDHDDGNQRAA